MAKMRGPRRMTQVVDGFPAEFLESARSDLDGVRDEIVEWAENMEGNSMEHLPKYEEVSEARDALETVVDTCMDEVMEHDLLEVPKLEDYDGEACPLDTLLPKVQVTFPSSKKAIRKRGSRNGRIGDACAYLYAVTDAIDEKLHGTKDDSLDESDLKPGEDSTRVKLEDLRDLVLAAVNEAETVCCPGMF